MTDDKDATIATRQSDTYLFQNNDKFSNYSITLSILPIRASDNYVNSSDSFEKKNDYATVVAEGSYNHKLKGSVYQFEKKCYVHM